MHPPARLPLTLLVACLAASCSLTPRPVPESAHSGRTRFEALLDVAPGERLVLAPNESFELPLPDPGNALPIYPEALLARRLPPRRLCLRVSIDALGQVIDSERITDTDRCSEAAAVEPEFIEAATIAVRQWRFDPAFRCIHPAGQAPSAGCGLDDSRIEYEPVSLVWRFSFEQIDGRGQSRLD